MSAEVTTLIEQAREAILLAPHTQADPHVAEFHATTDCARCRGNAALDSLVAELEERLAREQRAADVESDMLSTECNRLSGRIAELEQALAAYKETLAKWAASYPPAPPQKCPYCEDEDE